MADRIQEKGKIRYIEPTMLDSNGDIVVPSNAIIHPYEDYSMAVDLTVQITDRYACGLKDETGEGKQLIFSSNKGSIHFIGGTDGFLTTNYTDISMKNPEQNTQECLGIESIRISYNSWFYPEVDITFFDVRGASLMQKMEQSNNNSDAKSVGEANNRNFFKSLFMFPYPLFQLTVKGFYGNAVTYNLSVEKTDIVFDSNKGGFQVNAHFIGYMYGVYTDIPMTYLAIAPYTPDGEKYWEQQTKESNRFYYHDEAGNPIRPMMTFPELREAVAKAMANNDKGTQEERETKKQNEANIAKNTETIKSINEFLNQLGPNAEKIIIGPEESKVAIAIKTKNSDTQQYDKDYSDTFNALKKNLSNNSLTTEYVEDFEGLRKMRNYDNDSYQNRLQYRTICAGSFYVLEDKGLIGADYNEFVGGKDEAETIRNYYLNKNIFSKEREYVYAIPSDVVSFLNPIKEKLQENINACEEGNKKIEQTILEERDKSVIQALGFVPSIQNIYEMTFAHMETFINIYYTMLAEIKNKLDSNDASRKISTYGLDVSSTDIKGKKRDDIPPFPLLTAKNKDGKDGKNVVTWLCDVNEKLADLDEIKFVNNFLQGASFYNKTMEDIEKTLEDLAERRKNGGIIDNYPQSTSTKKFIPLTNWDYINNGEGNNPYKFVKNRTNRDSEQLIDETLVYLTLRLYYAISRGITVNKEAETMGKVEAYNFFKAFGVDRLTEQQQDMIQKFVKYTEDNLKKYDFTTKLNLSDVLTTNILSKVPRDDKYFYTWNSGNTKYLPIANESIEDISKKLIEKDYHNFLSLSDSASSENTFHLIGGNSYFSRLSEDIMSSVKDGSLDEYANALDNLSSTLANDVYYDGRDDRIGQFDKYAANAFVSLSKKGKFKGISQKDIDSLYKTTNFGNPGKEDRVIPSSASCIFEGKYSLFTDSINGTNIYYLQNEKAGGNINSVDAKLSKAFVFLFSLNFDGLLMSKNNFTRNGIYYLVDLLREGACYWREEIVKGGEITVSGVTISDIKLPTGKKAEFDETYYVKNKGFVYTENHQKWYMPQGTTQNRKDYLKTLFVYWATKNFIYSTAEKKLSENAKNEIKSIFDRTNFDFAHIIDYFELVSGGTALVNLTDIKYDSLSENNKKVYDSNFEFRDCVELDTLTTLMVRPVTMIDYNIHSDSVAEKHLKDALKSFSETLKGLYGETLGKINNETYGTVQDPAEFFKDKNTLHSTYLVMKNLYDRWFCSSNKKKWELPYDSSGNRIDIPDSEFSNFKYLDNFYNKIGQRLLANASVSSNLITKLLPSSNSNTDGETTYQGVSLYEYLTEVAQQCGGILLSLPLMWGLDPSNKDGVANMFKPQPITTAKKTDTSTYVFLYTYQPSYILNIDDDSDEYAYSNDAFDIADVNGNINSILPDTLSKIEEGTDYIPAFGVTYGRQNQSYFKSIKLSSESPGVTEASIRATFNIASHAENGEGGMTVYGQDLYRVYSNYSYKCDVTMMGDSQIMPLMYFQLNNIPMWRGAYMVIGVEHTIGAGTMETSFTGYRINKNAIPMSDNILLPTEPSAYTDFGDFSTYNGTNVSGTAAENYSIGDGSYYAANSGTAAAEITKVVVKGKGYNKASGFTLFEDFMNAKKLPRVADIPLETLFKDPRDKRDVNKEIMDNLVELMQTIINPSILLWREKKGNKNYTAIATSGFRTQYREKPRGGASRSAHMIGAAVDLQPAILVLNKDGKLVPEVHRELAKEFAETVFEYCQKTGTDFDQILLEHTSGTASYWVHVGLKNWNGDRRNDKLFIKV